MTLLAESGNAAVHCLTGYMCPLTGNRIKASPAKSCQLVPKTPMKVGEPWATIGQTATHAGQYSNTASLPSSYQNGGDRRLARSGEMHGLFACKELKSLPLCTRNLNNPYIEKEARLRSQQLFFHVPVLDEVNSAREEKHKKHNRPMGYLKPSEGKDLVAWKIFGSEVGSNNQSSLWKK